MGLLVTVGLDDGRDVVGLGVGDEVGLRVGLGVVGSRVGLAVVGSHVGLYVGELAVDGRDEDG